jgi:hypothetical protein
MDDWSAYDINKPNPWDQEPPGLLSGTRGGLPRHRPPNGDLEGTAVMTLVTCLLVSLHKLRMQYAGVRKGKVTATVFLRLQIPSPGSIRSRRKNLLHPRHKILLQYSMLIY